LEQPSWPEVIHEQLKEKGMVLGYTYTNNNKNEWNGMK
jgi:hypothetical protein